MRHDTNPPSSRTAGPTGNLARLHDLSDYKVASGDPDVRGWHVKTADGQRAGRVDSLIVDIDAMEVRFLDVELDRKTLNLKDERHVLVPLADARLDDDHDDVLLGKSAAEVASLQPYQPGQPIGASHASGHRSSNTDTSKFYGKRGGTGAVERMTLSEEEMRVGKRQTQAGVAEVHKSVDTEHVSKRVPVAHEDVSIERRAISPGDDTRPARIGEDEVRIPLSAEEAVIEKRTVPKEEVVIRKTTVQGEQEVEADLRKERVDVDRKGPTGKGRKH